MSGKKQKWWERLEFVTRNITASMDATDADVRALADMQEAFKSISKTHTLWLERLGRRIATLEDRLSPPECQSEATSQNTSANNDTNQSDCRGSAGQSADDVLKTSKHHDLRNRIANVIWEALRKQNNAVNFDALADAVIRELGLQQEFSVGDDEGGRTLWLADEEPVAPREGEVVERRWISRWERDE